MPIVCRKAINDPKLQWFRDARFGMFIHFGLYALLGRGEWVQYKEQIPRKRYEKLMRRFNPSRFNADEWVNVAERAGCRYIAMTAKHHDGFCLFDSSLTDFKITNTPFGRDLVGELVSACQRRGMRIGIYYSQPDWHHPNFVHQPGAFKDVQFPLPGQKPDWPAYVRYYHGQVEELCTKYGKINGIWFDGTHKSEEEWQGRKIYRLIKKYQPGAVVNDRARYGDIFTPERTLPDDLTGYMFEACDSVSPVSWGYKTDSPLRSIPSLIENLVRVISKGGNYLLNVGPHPDGRIPKEQSDRMAKVGKWLRDNGEAVFKTLPLPHGSKFDNMPATRNAKSLYLMLPRWPDADRVTLPALRRKPAKAFLLTGKKKLSVRTMEKGVEIGGLPMMPPDAALNVIRLDFPDGTESLTDKQTNLPERLAELKADRPMFLAAADAKAKGLGVKGSRIYIAPGGTLKKGKKAQSFSVANGWLTTEQSLNWNVAAKRAGRYEARILLACARPFHGSTFRIASRQGKIEGIVKPTKPGTLQWQTVGALQVPHGHSCITLHPLHMPYAYMFAAVAGISLKHV